MTPCPATFAGIRLAKTVSERYGKNALTVGVEVVKNILMGCFVRSVVMNPNQDQLAELHEQGKSVYIKKCKWAEKAGLYRNESERRLRNAGVSRHGVHEANPAR